MYWGWASIIHLFCSRHCIQGLLMFDGYVLMLPTLFAQEKQIYRPCCASKNKLILPLQINILTWIRNFNRTSIWSFYSNESFIPEMRQPSDIFLSQKEALLTIHIRFQGPYLL
uniref:Putative ovule protein n=1 Tax=Solanum chacoense TaxID=4108 RepID=A0A0V0HE27_SOLCH